MCLIPVIYIRYDCCHVFSCPDWGQTRNSGRPTSTAGLKCSAGWNCRFMVMVDHSCGRLSLLGVQRSLAQ